MKLTVLVDNNTYIDKYYLGEPALSYYIEDGNERILFDTGYSDAFIRNAEAMGIDISAVSTVVLSHGHNDHTGGMQYLMDRFQHRNYKVIAHPHVFKKRVCEGLDIGAPLSEAQIKQVADVYFTKSPVSISKNIMFLGEIPATTDFEPRLPMGVIEDGELHEDYITDDSAIVYHGNEGLFIITGCSHSGICNIIEHAKRVCHEDNIIGVIGGMHLMSLSERVTKTIAYFNSQNIKDLFPCHCVSFEVKAEMYRSLPVREVGVGLEIEIEF